MGTPLAVRSRWAVAPGAADRGRFRDRSPRSWLERKEQTQPFVMSLPVTPMDVFWGKLLANLVIFLVPFLFVTGGMVGADPDHAESRRRGAVGAA
ncbi:MAG: hypothetical protein LKM39_07905 [Chiayiivirga sp.]|jgi:hypothetical protein|nr:hypothetical protein [Chiayiivirga sp.]